MKEKIGTHNIILGNGANTIRPSDSYMLVLGKWKQKMTKRQYKEAHKAIMEVIENVKREYSLWNRIKRFLSM